MPRDSKGRKKRKFLQTLRTQGRIFRILEPRQRLGLVTLIGLRILGVGFDLVGIASVGVLIMAATEGRVVLRLGNAELLNLENIDNNLIIIVAVFSASAFLLRGLYTVLLGRMSYSYLARIATAQSVRLLTFVSSRGLPEFQKLSLPRIQFLVSSSTNLAFTSSLGAVAAFTADLVTGAVLVATLISVQPLFGSLGLLYALITVIIIQLIFMSKTKRAGGSTRKSTEQAGQAVLDIAKAYREIIAFGVFNEFEARFRKARQEYSDAAVRGVTYRLFPRTILESALMVGLVGLFLATTIESGPSLTGPELGVFAAAFFRLSTTLVPLQNSMNELNKNERQVMPAVVIMEKEKAERNRKQHIGSVPPAETLSFDLNKPPGLSVRDVTFRYEASDKDVLRGISLEVPPGSFAALIGPSGAGKSTLADMILGLISPKTGSVTVGDQPAESVSGTYPGLFAYVPQKPGIVAGTVAENIALGVDRGSIDEKRVWDSLQKVGLADYVQSLPDSIHTDLGPQVDGLSGGQLQRIGFARVFYTSPKLIVLDEATSGLDLLSEQIISESVRELRKSATVVAIAHKLHTIHEADVVFIVEDGLISGSGTLAELRPHFPLIADYANLTSLEGDKAPMYEEVDE